MSQTPPNLFLSIGKQVKDEYGRVIGKIASVGVTPHGKFDTIFIEQGDGKFAKFPTEHLRFEGAEITLISTMKSDACAFSDQIPLIWRKDQALGELAAKRKISPELYSELHNSFDGVLVQLKSEAQVLLEKMAKEIDRCTEEIKALNYALVHLELEHEIGKIDVQSYETAFTMIQDNLKRVNIERSDLEVARGKLSNIMLGDKSDILEKTAAKTKESTLKTPTPIRTSSDLPEPPVVVYVKEIGKAGI